MRKKKKKIEADDPRYWRWSSDYAEKLIRSYVKKKNTYPKSAILEDFWFRNTGKT